MLIELDIRRRDAEPLQLEMTIFLAGDNTALSSIEVDVGYRPRPSVGDAGFIDHRDLPEEAPRIRGLLDTLIAALNNPSECRGLPVADADALKAVYPPETHPRRSSLRERKKAPQALERLCRLTEDAPIVPGGVDVKIHSIGGLVTDAEGRATGIFLLELAVEPDGVTAWVRRDIHRFD